MRIGPHRADHQHVLRAQPEPGERRIHHQLVVSLNEGGFAARVSQRGPETAKHDINRVNNLRQRIAQLRRVGI